MCFRFKKLWAPPFPLYVQYIPTVKTLAFLDLDQMSEDFEIEHFSKVSHHVSHIADRWLIGTGE